jgi:GPH family glycoside/pentoside/hexuronide:cation symporter
MEGDSQDVKSRTENPEKPILPWGRFLGWLLGSLSASNNVSQKSPSDRRRKISVRTKLLFASGTLQEATVTAGGLTTILFYNQVLGVAPSLCGTAFLIVSLVDAVSDPLIGALSDRFRSQWGRRHPFMLASALPMAIAFYFLYQPLEGLSEMALFSWLTSFLVLLRLGQTFYLIPHDALGAELTDDYDERTSIFGYNSFVQMILSMVTTGLMYYAIFPSNAEFENGLLNEARYFLLASIGSATIFFSIIVCALGTLDQIPFLHDMDGRKKFPLRQYIAELAILLRNRNYLAVCISMLTIYVGLGIIGVVTHYAHIYVFELRSEQLIWGAAAKLPGVFIMIPLLAFLSKRFDKKTIFVAITSYSGVLASSPFFMKMFDLFPANDSSFFLVAVYGPIFLAFLLFPVTMIIIDSQLVDISDEHELKSGSRSEGIVFSIRSFANKATHGLGGLIAGFGLEFINFPENAEVGALPQEALDGLLIMNGPLYLGMYLLGSAIMLLYKIDRQRHAEIMSELEARRSG